jgi:hypothetical protein
MDISSNLLVLCVLPIQTKRVKQKGLCFPFSLDNISASYLLLVPKKEHGQEIALTSFKRSNDT